MTLTNLKKNHERLKWLASGAFTERDFDYKIDATDNPRGGEDNQGEGGWSTMGTFVNKAGQKRKELIIFKAKNSLKEFEMKYDKDYNPIKKDDKNPVIEVPKPITVDKPKPKEKK